MTLDLKASEIDKLVKHIGGLYRLHKKNGVPITKTHFIKVAINDDSSKIDKSDLTRLFRIGQQADIGLMISLFEWMSELENAQDALKQLSSLESDNLSQISNLVGLASLNALIKVWNQNQKNADEEFWQKILDKHAQAFSQIFSSPVVLNQSKAYVGGKNLGNKGGHIADFLLSNQLTRNAVIVELKTPCSKLLGKEYRIGVYGVSDELSGAISQVLTYRASLIREFDNLARQEETGIEAFAPQCMIIAGHASDELTSMEQKRSFELFRDALQSDVSVVTYDEVFGKLKGIIDLIGSSNS